MRLCIKLLLFPKYLTATFLCSSYPLRPKVTKTLSPVWDCFAPQPGLGVLQSSQETILLPQQHQIIPLGKNSVAPLGLAGAVKVVTVLFRFLSFQKTILNKSQHHVQDWHNSTSIRLLMPLSSLILVFFNLLLDYLSLKCIIIPESGGITK